eukprot:TRINITY_DN4247_c1_g2_i1.p1 TRINITY_DN4247_c1_g2~~TRINITY_DN4247_c1_g2_i1.p1  ORF type:complete len:417 (+),score=73.27 TRINITY_DN4247_c1_g2_i1:55-1305(+)
MMRPQVGSGGMSTQRIITIVCGVSMLMNVGLVLNSSIPPVGGGCVSLLSQCENNFKALKASTPKRADPAPCPECVCNCKGSTSESNTDQTEGSDQITLQDDEKQTLGKDPPWVWIPGRERTNFGVWKANGIYKTDNTFYDPEEDARLQKAHPTDKNGYARSPVPMGSARIRVSHSPKEKWITLDEFAFAHDVFFEEWQRFSFGNWLGVKCQQDPMDAFAIQDMLWRVKPDLIIEVGTNNGGGAIFYASIMNNYNKDGKIVTLDVKPVNQNWMTGKNKDNCKECITGDVHPLWTGSDMINFIKGDITRKDIQAEVEKFVNKAKTVLVVEDASHRYPETLTRMNVIYKYVTPGSYMLVQDTKMDRFVSRLRKKYGGLKFGPMRSVDEFIRANKDWEIDRTFEYYIYSQHHRGFLKRLK